jgi:hypothetical protein
MLPITRGFDKTHPSTVFRVSIQRRLAIPNDFNPTKLIADNVLALVIELVRNNRRPVTVKVGIQIGGDVLIRVSAPKPILQMLQAPPPEALQTQTSALIERCRSTMFTSD